MADYRYIHTKIWRDEWFSELQNDGKVFWFYLLTNPAASVCGMFRLPDKFIAFDTGLPLERVRELKEEFSKAGKIQYEGDIIWVTKMREFHFSASPKIAACILKDLEAIPASEIRDMYLRKYCIDTPSIPYHNRTKPNRTKQNKTERTPDAATPLPPQITIFLENGGKFPKGTLSGGVSKMDKAIEFISQKVSCDPESLERWAKVVEGYTRQWSGTSYTVMVNDYYLAGRIPGQSNHNGSKPQSAMDIALEHLKKLEAQNGK